MKIPSLPLLQKYRGYLGWPLASIIISLPLLVLVVIPQIRGLIATYNQINEAKNQVNSLKNKDAALESVNLDSYRDNLNLALAALPLQRDLPSSLDQILSLLIQNKLQLSEINFTNPNSSQPANGTKEESYQIKLGVVGQPTALRNFFNQLKDTPQVMKLTQLDISGERGDLFNAEVTINSFYQAPPQLSDNLFQEVEGLSSQDLELLSKLQRTVPAQVTVPATPLGPRGKSDPFK